MKKIAFLFQVLLIGFLTSCDKVKNPIVPTNKVVGSKFIKKNNLEVSDIKKTLLEDYTGARCQNCPRAARTATALEAQNKGELIIVAIHAGGFAVPFGSKFKSDFRTNTGDLWNSSSGFAIPGYPSGVFNRKSYASNPVVNTDTKWSTIYGFAKEDPMVVKLDLTTEYDTTVSALNVTVKAKFRKSYSNNVMLSVIVIEDGIVGAQVDGNEDLEEYEFEHMLRGTLNGDWGSQLNSKSPIKFNDTANFSVRDFALLKGFNYIIPNADPKKEPLIKPIVVNDKKTSVVVFAYDAVTKEVLQTEKVKIR
jgi:hypothetical protein